MFRDANWKGLAQFVNVDGGSRYKLTAFVKLLNIANNKTYQDVQLIMKCEDENGSYKIITIATINFSKKTTTKNIVFFLFCKTYYNVHVIFQRKFD
jgi:hypothetical protein